jgi:hypothetical protein
MKLAATYLLFIPVLFRVLVLSNPLVAVATQHSSSGFGTPSGSSGFGTANGSSGTSLENPLRFGSFCQLIKGLLQAIVAIGVPVAVLFLVWVGFKFVLAQGDPTKLSEARKNFLNTVIGIGIFLGAWIIAQVIASTVQQFGVTLLSCQ